MNVLNLVLFLIVLAMQAGDAYLTWRILRGGGRELNPVVRFLIERFGLVPGLAIAKGALALLTGLYLVDLVPALLGVMTVYAWVLWHNWQQLQKQLAKGGIA
jgi:hypothetical protein